MTFKKKVIVALDSDDFNNIEKLIDTIKHYIFGIKIGYEFFFNFGLDGYKKIKKKNINIFLDLKLHDIPNTVKHGIKAIADLNPYFTTVHISGGDKMLEAAILNKKQTKVLGISVLTSLDDDQVKRYYGRQNIELLVSNYIHYALENNLDGIVCSPYEIKKVKEGNPNAVDALISDQIQLVINTTKTQGSIRDSYSIRRTSLMFNIPYFTTIAGSRVAVDAIEHLKNNRLIVKSLQSIH